MSIEIFDRVMNVFENSFFIDDFVNFEIVFFEIKREAISIVVFDAIEKNILMSNMTTRKLILSIEQTIVVNRANDFVLHIKNIFFIFNDFVDSFQFFVHELLYKVKKTN